MNHLEMVSRISEQHVNPVEYGWEITKDYLFSKDIDDRDAAGTQGPHSLNTEWLAAMRQAGQIERFRMYDDDGELYYEGFIAGDYEGFEPLEDFGMPNAGCTGIKYYDTKSNTWEWL